MNYIMPVKKSRISMEDAIKSGICLRRVFTVDVLGNNFKPIDSFEIIVNITEEDFKEVAKLACKKRLGFRKDYAIHVIGEITDVIIYKDRIKSINNITHSFLEQLYSDDYSIAK